MKKILLLTSALIFMVGCETGVQNKTHKIVEVPSGIVDKRDVRALDSSTFASRTHATNKTVATRTPTTATAYKGMIHKSSSKAGVHRIYSKSAQPGFYLQYALFEKYRPNKSFLKPLNRSKYNYIVLNKSNRDYVLIGPYKSYKEAHKRISRVKKHFHKQTFVVEVLRP